MKQKIFKFGARLLILSAVFLFPVLSAPAQEEAQTTNQNFFAAVPPKERDNLIRNLKKYIEHYKKREWGAAYDMMFGDKEPSKEEFIKKASASNAPQIIDFRPTRAMQKNSLEMQKDIEYMPGADWMMIGDLKMLNKDKTEDTEECLIYAKQVKDKWYFTSITFVQITM